jgi:hypothetical protein
MRIARVEVTNLRSFGPDKVVAAFPSDLNLVALVGANNAGKSNMIDAVRLALAAARRSDLDPADFHQLDLAEEVRVEVQLWTPLKRENIFRKTDEIYGFSYRAWRSDHGDDKGKLKSENYCLTAGGDIYRPPAGIRRGANTPVDPAAEPIRHLPAQASRIVPLLGRVHYLTPNLRRAFASSGYGVLAQLLDIYREDFRSEQNLYKLPDGHEVTHAEAYDRFAVRMEQICARPSSQPSRRR